MLAQCAVIMPSWSETSINPCANKPNGWQLLYWPEDGQCYRIFQKGYPCPETMELIPGKNGTAQCNCPPGTALHSRDAKCYKIYYQGPCNKNEYFGPVKKAVSSYQSHRWGACFEIEYCDKGKVFWPKDGKCYNNLTKGPCPEGLLLSTKERLGECSCDNDTMQHNYWEPGQSCHEHYLQGPCEIGKLFLPTGQCDCNSSMIQYYPEDKKCYAIGSQGPCKNGHLFQTKVIKYEDKQQVNGVCVCKEGYMKWKENDFCYQPFTRGPCQNGEMLDLKYDKNGSEITCVQVPCSTGKLFFPGGKGCHKVRTQGPCPAGQLVLYQDNIDPSMNGISYLGICGCQNIENDSSFYTNYKNDKSATKTDCSEEQNVDNETMSSSNEKANIDDVCGSGYGFVLWKDNSCWQLYSQGPCREGEWLVPDRGKGQRKGRGWLIGKCECRPGYSTTLIKNDTSCIINTETLTKLFNSKV
nr:uncharacterized protein LOC106682046 isoform X2 [Halyomorpha halys]